MLASCSECGATCGEERVQTSGNGYREDWWQEAKIRATKTWNTRATQPQAPQGGWQPIETAPKDGSVIQICSGGDSVRAAYWYAAKGVEAGEGNEKYPWVFLDPQNAYRGNALAPHALTAWRPLDAAPTETPEAGK